MSIAHVLGFPRIGANRELKKALEAYWKGESTQAQLQETGYTLRVRHWEAQRKAGMDFVAVGDFSFYDQVLDTSALLGVVPPRFDWHNDEVDLDTYFRMARGAAPTGQAVPACEMTKWFDTNYHYLMPEFDLAQSFRIASSKLFNEVTEARALGFPVKAVLLGPLTYLWLGKTTSDFERLALLDLLLPVYRKILTRLGSLGVQWVQIDEPALVLDLPLIWRNAYDRAYSALAEAPVQLLLATYFGGLEENFSHTFSLPVAGWHLDTVRAPEQLDAAVTALPEDKVLSLGCIDGRNVWRADLNALLTRLTPAQQKLGNRLWLSASCSLQHVPVTLEHEHELEPDVASWLAFADQKLDELSVLKNALNHGRDSEKSALAASAQMTATRLSSPRIHAPAVKKRVAELTESQTHRHSEFSQRRLLQHAHLQLPLFPTTTIGSFPQTAEIRNARRDLRSNRISEADYREKMRNAIADAVHRQEALGLDVLVHGEAERNDMVEYFGELLNGVAVTEFGWVQSYGSRCVKPPIIYGDVSRPRAMTVEWAEYAQSLTQRPMKGMLTGPVTMLQWSFVRDDQTRADTALQLAFAIRDEVVDLERAGIRIIQIDEPALREGLPLLPKEHAAYLNWAVRAFRVSASGVQDATQIHTHMCYSEFNGIIKAIAAMDADVITIETARSDMELLKAFTNFSYPNGIGPGVYDIHSPRVPDFGEMVRLLRKAQSVLPHENLWVNPDCGLKTRAWPEVEAALRNMVQAAHELRRAQT